MKFALCIIIAIILGATGYALLIDKDAVRAPDANPSESATSQSSNTTPSSNATSGESIMLAGKGLREVPKDLLDNSSVVLLDVSNNNLTGALPAEIRKLTNLITLNAANNAMTGIPAEIGQLNKLEYADFSNNQLSGLPSEIGNLRNLKTLDLRGNPNISQQDLSGIKAKLPNTSILTD